MADITGVFKSTIKMLKVRHKDIAAIKNIPADDQPHSKPNGTVNGEREKRFSEEARQIVANITRLRTFLVKNRKAYMAASSQLPLLGGSTKLSEEERDKIDADAMSYMKLCNETLATCRKEVLRKELSAQLREHRSVVFSMIADYLKVVCQIYSEQKAIRVQRAVDWQKMRRLELSDPHVSRPIVESSEPNDRFTNSNNTDTSATVVQSSQAFDLFHTESVNDDEITSEEAQLFEVENEQLYNDMTSTLEEVRQIEGKVVEISRLQDIFTEKVLEQDADIDRIGDTMVHSTENIVQGNDDIREAMKNNAGMRVWIIFGICVLSFTLLFLDWYND